MLTQVDADGGQKFHFLIPHNSNFKLYWDFFMAALILYVCINVPMQEGECQFCTLNFTYLKKSE
jgi:hypothetical protein